MTTKTFALHRNAAVKAPRRKKRPAAPVVVLRADPAVMTVARSLASCPGRMAVKHDGSVLVLNSCRCHGQEAL